LLDLECMLDYTGKNLEKDLGKKSELSTAHRNIC
jgi:hypothetical protein